MVDEEIDGVAYGLLFGPASGDEVATLLSHALHFEELLGVFVEDVEDFPAECLHEAFCIGGADPFDETGAEALLDVVRLGREFRADHLRPKLVTVLAGLPAPRRMDVQARRHGRRETHDRIGPPVLLVGDAQDAEAVFRIVEGHALDETLELGGRTRLFGRSFFLSGRMKGTADISVSLKKNCNVKDLSRTN